MSVDKSSSKGQLACSEDRKELPPKTKYLTCAVLFYGFITFGAAQSAYGPVTTTIQNKYGVDDETISRVFTVQTGCGLVGTFIGGVFLFNVMNRQLAVIGLICVQAFCTFYAPHCPTLESFFVVIGILGGCLGAYDAANFVWIVEMMQSEVAPYVQTLHFCYAIGSFIASGIMSQFLPKEEDADKFTADEKMEKLITPFSIIGAMVALNAILQIVLFIFFRYHKPPPEATETSLELSQDLETTPIKNPSHGPVFWGKHLWSWAKFRFILLCCLFYGASQGMEMTAWNFTSKYAQNIDLHLYEYEAAYVLTAMQAAFAAGRGVSIFLVLKISVKILLCVNIVLLVISNVVMFGWSYNSRAVLYTAGIFFGLGASSSYPSFAAFIERHLNITNTIGALFLIFGTGVASLYPLIVGAFIEEHPIALNYVISCSILIIIGAVGTLYYLTHKNKTRY